MIFIPTRGTGLLLPFYIGICGWIVGFFFDKRDYHDHDYLAWVFLATTLVTSLHGVRILLTRNSGHGSMRRSIWHDHFLFIPILVWPVILIGVSIYNFIQ